MSQAYCASRISKHMAKTAEGFLICLSAPICRSGYQTYRVSEVDPSQSDDSDIEIYRPPSEVASAATIASAEGAVVTLKHPSKFVTPDTFSWSAGGHCQNVRLGPKDEDGNIQLVGDLHIKDRTVIEAVERGVRDLSCGYTYDLVQLSNGDWAQTNIRMNHIAIVESGRAGTSKIQDSKDNDMDANQMDRLCSLLEKLCARLGTDRTPRGQQDDDPDSTGVLGATVPGWSEGTEIGSQAAEGNLGPAASAVKEVGKEVEEKVGLATGLSELDEDPDGDLNPEYELSASRNNRTRQPGMGNFTPVRSSPNNSRTGATGNTNPVSAADARAALQNLRALRPFIQANGDSKAIDAFNKAIRAVKDQIAFGNRYDTRTSAYDSKSLRRDEAADFEANAARFHGKRIQIHAEVNAPEEQHKAEDTRRHEETFDEQVERIRIEQIEKFTPRRRR